MHDRRPTPKRIACVHRMTGWPSCGPRAQPTARASDARAGIVVDDVQGLVSRRAAGRSPAAADSVRAAVDHVPSCAVSSRAGC